MTRKILVVGMLTALTLFAAPTVLAAPARAEVDGTVTACTPDEVTLEYTDDAGNVQIVTLSEGGYDCTVYEVGSTHTFTIGDDDGEAVCEAGQHPVVCRIANQLGVDYEVMWGYFKGGTFEYTDEDGETYTYEGVIGLGRIQKAIRLSELLGDGEGGMSWEELLAYHLQGNGWGSIIAAHKLSDDTDLSMEELLTFRENGGNWGDLHYAARLASDEQSTQQLLDMHERCNWGQIRKGECNGEDAAVASLHSQGGNNPNQGGGNPNRGGNNPNRGPGNNNSGGNSGRGGNPNR